MKLTSLIPIVLISVLAVGASAQQRDKNKGAPRNRPNIIFFISDDQVKEEVGCYGGKVLTPHLDRLAREGMRMDNAHVVSTVCTPSRYSLFTGRYPGNSWFKPYLAEFPKDRHGAPGFNVGLEEDNMNVGNVLRLAGYVTGHVGKLHVGPELKKPDEFAAFGLYDTSARSGVDPNDPAVIAGWRKNEKWYRKWIMDRGFSWAKHVYWGNGKHPYPHHNPEWTLEAALEFIEENHNKPFYLHYATTMMHGGPKGWSRSLEKPLASGAGKLEKLPGVIPSRAELCKQVDEVGLDRSVYGFTWMDATVGAMLDKLDKLGIADNTLFVFVTDHGTKGKWSLHDHNGTAIPCIIRWPGVVKPGSVCNNLVQATDMVPTFFDVAGASVPEGYRMDGKSIKPILANPNAKIHDHLYFELGYARGIRTDEWKYIAIRYGAERFGQIEAAKLTKLPNALAYGGGGKNASNHLQRRPHYLEPDQLYNLANDPLEMKNLAKNPRFKAQLEKMRGLLTAKLKAQGRPFGEFVPGADSVQAEEIWPYLEKMKQLRPVKKGFEIIGDATNAPAGTPAKELNREERKKFREERKKERLENNGHMTSSLTVADGKHLFILSGQSNMRGHRPQDAFSPAVEKVLGKANVIVIQDALGGQPIQRWWKSWKSPKGEKPANRGDLYDRLMGKVNPAIKGKTLETVTFIWMQGESDAKQLWGSVYANSLKGLYEQLSDDLNRKDINFVIGRLSDFDMVNKRYPHWTMVREAQVKVADSDPRFVWVNTNDLNDDKNRRGKEIKDDLHYSAEGYKILGKRFAESALKLILK